MELHAKLKTDYRITKREKKQIGNAYINFIGLKSKSIMFSIQVIGFDLFLRPLNKLPEIVLIDCRRPPILKTQCPCQTGPRSPEHVLQFCPLFREDRQDHSPQSMFYSSAPSSEKTDRTTVNRARSTVLPPLQRSKNTAVAPWSNAARTAVGQNVGLFEHINLHPNHFLKQNHARTQ